MKPIIDILFITIFVSLECVFAFVSHTGWIQLSITVTVLSVCYLVAVIGRGIYHWWYDTIQLHCTETVITTMVTLSCYFLLVTLIFQSFMLCETVNLDDSDQTINFKNYDDHNCGVCLSKFSHTSLCDL